MSKTIEHLAFSSSSDIANTETAALDAEIRELARQCKMPSANIELDYQTEPSFFSALAQYGEQHDLVLIKPESFAGLAGMGVRSIRRSYLGGQPANIGYLHHLRFHPDIRGGSFLARGYKAFRQIFNAQPLVTTLTSILEDNINARKLLENDRATGYMPRYQPISRFMTALIPLSGPGNRWPIKYRSMREDLPCQIRTLQESDLPDLLKLFDESGKYNDGAPRFFADDFSGSHTNTLPGLKITDMVGVFHQNELLAAIGIWNQQHYRQIVLLQLCKSLRSLSNLWQLGSNIWGKCPIPAPGNPVNVVLLDPWCIKPGMEAELMPMLIKAAVREAQKRGALFAALGITEKNPAIKALRSVFFISYWSIIYQVFWPETGSYEFGRKQMQIANLGAL